MVSVIVPVYNAKAFMEETLFHIQNQTYHDIEIICVDDGSTDNTTEIIETIAESDDRIKLIRQNNQFAGVARNNGLAHAKGEYVLFLDADDIFEHTLIEKCLNKAKETNADIVLFDGDTFDSNTAVVKKESYMLDYERIKRFKVFNRHDIPNEIMNVSSPQPWLKFYRKDFILHNGIRFQALHNTNDVFFTMLSMCLAERIAYVNEKLVYYRKGQSTNLQSIKKKQPTCFIEAFSALYEELVRRGIYQEVEHSYVEVVLTTCDYNLKSVRSREGLKKVCAALCDSVFFQSGMLDHEERFYRNIEQYYRVKGALFMHACMEDIEKAEKPGRQELIKEKSGNEPVAVSVIIPVYNTEKYLEECLDSICGQTLRNIEIICVDDGSTDSSLEIMKAYAEKDNRITVIRQENAGPSRARNTGIRHAQGEYFYYMDSDDWLEREALQELYTKASREQLDLILFDGKSFYENEELSQILKNDYIRIGRYDGVQNGKTMLAAMKQSKEYRVQPCLQFVSREHFMKNDLWFIDGICHEDNHYTFQNLLKAERVAYINRAYFHRRLRPGSIMTSKKSYRHCYGEFVVFLKMLELMEKMDLNDCTLENEMLAEVVFGMLIECRKDYRVLDKAEKNFYRGLYLVERSQFENFVVRTARGADDEARYLRASRSYKIGRAVTFFPRKIRHILKSFR